MAGLQSQQYRDFIDRLVWHCLEGQGQIGPDRARAGLWNANATADSGDRQHERDVLAAMLAQRFEAGVHTTLVVLHEARIEPFEDGYEGTLARAVIGSRMPTRDEDRPRRDAGRGHRSIPSSVGVTQRTSDNASSTETSTTLATYA